MSILYKNMVIRRAHENLAFFYLQLVIGLDHGHSNVLCQKRHKEFRVLETAVLHHHDGERKILRQIAQHRLERLETAERRADDDQPVSHQTILRYSRAVLSTSS